MRTITIPKKEYEQIQRRAELYDSFLKKLESDLFPVEMYTERRLKAFLKEDKISPRARQKVKKLLKSNSK